MTPQQLKAMKMALEALKTSMYPQQKQLQAITALEEALKEHAMQEVQRLGQEIEQCQCPECQIKPHASDCAVHSEPAYPKGECDCGAQPEQEPVAFYVYKPTLPRGHLGNVSDGDLPWVYDQDPSSGYTARMLVYSTPPQRTWVGLTEDERDHLTGLHLYAVRGQVEAWIEGVDDFAQAYEAKLKEKNT